MSKHAVYWAETFEKANLCMDRIGNTRACYQGEYDCDIQEKAEAFEDRIRDALLSFGAHSAQKEDWRVVRTAAAMYDEWKVTLPKVAALEPEKYDRQMADKFRMIAERAAIAHDDLPSTCRLETDQEEMER